jgi:hypothetical protein
VTLLAETHVPDAAYEAVAVMFSPEEVAALLALWTLVCSTRSWCMWRQSSWATA